MNKNEAIKQDKPDSVSIPVDAIVKNTETDLIEFSKKFMTYKMTPLQETFIEILMAQKGKVVLSNYRRSYSTKNELTNYTLGKMKTNQTFALASPDGIRVFKMIDFKSATLNYVTKTK